MKKIIILLALLPIIAFSQNNEPKQVSFQKYF